MVTEKEKKLLEYMWEQMNNLEEFITRNGYEKKCMYTIILNPDIQAKDVTASTFYDNGKQCRSISKESYSGRKSTINERTWEE